MAIVKSDSIMHFKHLRKGSAFAAVMTLYTKSDGMEDPKEYLFYKTKHNKAITLDKRVAIHMLDSTLIRLCIISKS